MNVLILHDEVYATSRLDEADALVQAQAVAHALAEAGHTSRTLPVTLDLSALAQRLKHEPPDLVFNLVESLSGWGRLIHLVPALLDALEIPYTGVRTDAMFLTSNKVLAKSWLRARGIATPAWHMAGTAAPSNTNGRLPQCGPEIPASKRIPMPHSVTFPCRCIIKSIWEDASVGLTDESVVAVNSPQELDRLIRSRGPVLGGEAFAEEYVEGREFNVTLLADGDGVHPLPPAEIEFVDFPPGKPRIVGYAAKWQTDSIEYVATPRTLDFRPEDGPLIATLDALARDCWRLFDLRGYARVDFRVDAQGQPLVLEVNANPCLSPDAGFAAAATRAGLSFAQVVERIVADALRESHADLHSPYDPHSPRA